MGEFRMPSLGADMDRGTVTRWLVGPGDAVQRGDIVAVIETDKADVEVEVFQDGTVTELLVDEGAEVAVGTPLAVIDDAGSPASGVGSPTPGERSTSGGSSTCAEEPLAEERLPAEGHSAAPSTTVDRSILGERGGEAGGDGRGRASPRARRLARELGIDAGALAGTGPRGAVTGPDVEQAARRRGAGTEAPEERPTAATRRDSPPGAAPPSSPRPPTGDRSAAMRTAIARAMARSKREIPHYYLTTEIDFSAARGFLDRLNGDRPAIERVLPAALLLKATALAVREVPELNGHWVVDEYRPSEAVHVGVAISLRGGGLVAPAIHHTDTLTIDGLMAALRDLVGRARAGSLRASEMSDGTVTVTNLGDHGAQVVHGVIYPPQVALVGFGAITERPWATGGLLGVRPVVTATLAADHRASDGARGARLLELVDRRLQHPEEL